MEDSILAGIASVSLVIGFFLGVLVSAFAQK